MSGRRFQGATNGGEIPKQSDETRNPNPAIGGGFPAAQRPGPVPILTRRWLDWGFNDPMTYSQKLKDPRWQKTRLRVLERDNFTCICCESKQKQLHVHHCYYVSKREPWDYNLNTLVSLCADCHKSTGELVGPAHDICMVFEGAAVQEMERQHQNRANNVPNDDGAFYAFCRAAFQNGWPVSEAMNALRDASELGIIDSEWLTRLAKQVREIEKQKAVQ